MGIVVFPGNSLSLSLSLFVPLCVYVGGGGGGGGGARVFVCPSVHLSVLCGCCWCCVRFVVFVSVSIETVSVFVSAGDPACIR